MRRSIAAVDRLVALVVALLLIVGGALVIGWWAEIDGVRTLFAHSDRSFYAGAERQNWWPWAMAIAAASLLALGIWLLLINIRSNRIGGVELDGSGDFGVLTVNPLQVGDAAATMLARHPSVYTASATPAVEGGLRTLALTITAAADVPLDQLQSLARRTVADIDDAFGNTPGAPVVRCFVRYLPVQHE